MVLIFNSQSHGIVSEDLATFFFPKTSYSSSSWKNKIKRKKKRREPLSSRSLIKNVRLLRSVKSTSRPHFPRPLLLWALLIYFALHHQIRSREIWRVQDAAYSSETSRLLFIFFLYLRISRQDNEHRYFKGKKVSARRRQFPYPYERELKVLIAVT